MDLWQVYITTSQYVKHVSYLSITLVICLRRNVTSKAKYMTFYFPQLSMSKLSHICDECHLCISNTQFEVQRMKNGLGRISNGGKS